MKLLLRKLISVWVSVTFFLIAYILIAPRLNPWTIDYVKGIGLLVLFLSAFIIPITIIYGIIVSTIIERIMNRFGQEGPSKTYITIYIIIHSFAGLIFGIVLQNQYFMLIGTALALFFSIGDVLLKFVNHNKRELLYKITLFATTGVLLISVIPHL